MTGEYIPTQLPKEDMEELKVLLNLSFDFNNKITDKPLHDFVRKAILEYGTPELFKEAENVVKVLEKKFRKEKQINTQAENGWLQPIYAACYLHNLFYTSWNPVLSLVAARDRLTTLAEKCDVADSWKELIFQTIEGQLGADTPIPALTPHGDHPIKYFADACWIVSELNGNKLMPWEPISADCNGEE